MARPRPGEAPCRAHPMRLAQALCALCDAALCDECHRFRTGERPACIACAYEATTHTRRRTALAVAFLGISTVGGFFAARRWALWPDSGWALVLFGIAALCVTHFLAQSARAEKAPPIENRPEDLSDDPHAWDGAAHPYRGRARRVVTNVAPPLSGTSTALVVGLSFATCAVLLPATLDLPRWLEVETVLGGWWLFGALGLTILLHRGFRLKDDWIYFAPWERPQTEDRAAPGRKRSTGTGCSADLPSGCGSGCSDVSGEGFVAIVVIGVALVAALGAAWVLVEVAIPLLFLAVYALTTRAIARVARDRHECQGDLAKSALWGVVWASVYVAPLAALALGVHAALGR